MLPRIDFRQLAFSEPGYLWLLVIPLLLTVAWFWRFAARRADTQRLARARVIPVRERFAIAADLPFWLSLIAATACLILALARPHGPTTAVRQGGVDMVILMDGSASMRVKDVPGNRWQRSMKFVRMLGDSLSWKSDRIALALFAHIATPQIRLTRDPNTFFFFLDHLELEPTFRLEDETTWDTNLELGIYWGLRLIERDEEIHGKSPNAKLFVLVSDGEVWSGEVAKSLKLSSERNVPVFVVGAGTLAGGALPDIKDAEGQPMKDPDAPANSRLDRGGLQRIAGAGAGQYFELDRDGDRHIANAIIDAGKRQAPVIGSTEEAEELYWRFLVAAAFFAGIGFFFIRERTELWMQLAGTVLVLFGVSRILN